MRWRTIAAPWRTPALNIDEDLDGNTEVMGQWHIIDDGTDSTTWPERLTFWYDPAGSAAEHRTFYLNEYGEVRVASGKPSTVPFRVLVKEGATDPAHNTGVPVMQVMDNRDDRNEMFAVHNNGKVVAPNIGSKVIAVVEGTASGWETQEDGTVWLEYVF